jgi:hypothetical protein
MIEMAAFEEFGLLGRCSFALRTTWNEKSE